MKNLNRVALVLVIIGALNWGLIGLFNFNLVAAIFGAGSGLTRLIYVLVGISGVILAATAFSREPAGAPSLMKGR